APAPGGRPGDGASGRPAGASRVLRTGLPRGRAGLAASLGPLLRAHAAGGPGRAPMDGAPGPPDRGPRRRRRPRSADLGPLPGAVLVRPGRSARSGHDGLVPGRRPPRPVGPRPAGPGRASVVARPPRRLRPRPRPDTGAAPRPDLTTAGPALIGPRLSPPPGAPGGRPGAAPARRRTRPPGGL